MRGRGAVVNVAWLLAEGAIRAGGAPALISDDWITSYPQLLDRVGRLAAVVGVADPEWGELVRAFVVADRAIEAGELVDFCRGRLASFKRPRDVVFVAELPKNATGKVLKRA